MTFHEERTKRAEINRLADTLRLLAQFTDVRFTVNERSSLRSAAEALVLLWEDRRYAREQFCLLEVIESAARGVKIEPQEVAKSLGWDSSQAELDFGRREDL